MNIIQRKLLWEKYTHCVSEYTCLAFELVFRFLFTVLVFISVYITGTIMACRVCSYCMCCLRAEK